MSKCKVEFICESGQKIILDFKFENDALEYKPSFEPKVIDPKTDLGLAGQLCEMFLTYLNSENNSQESDQSIPVS